MEFAAYFTCYALPCTQPYRTRGQPIITAVGLAQHAVRKHSVIRRAHAR